MVAAVSALLGTLSDATVTGSLAFGSVSFLLVCSTFCGLVASWAGAFCELGIDAND